jgi:hypothetical protein
MEGAEARGTRRPRRREDEEQDGEQPWRPAAADAPPGGTGAGHVDEEGHQPDAHGGGNELAKMFLHAERSIKRRRCV